MAWLLSPEIEGIDRCRVLELAILHDVAESLAGDMTPYDQHEIATLTPDERRTRLDARQRRSIDLTAAKRAAETAAIEELIALLPADSGLRLRERWSELEQRTTPAARFVKELDILESFLQSREYLEEFPQTAMRSFLMEAREELTTPIVQQIRDAVSPNLPDD